MTNKLIKMFKFIRFTLNLGVGSTQMVKISNLLIFDYKFTVIFLIIIYILLQLIIIAKLIIQLYHSDKNLN